MLKTETPSRRHPDLDLYPVEQLVAALVDDQFWAVEAVRLASPQIAAAVTAALPRIAPAAPAVRGRGSADCP